MNEFEKNEYLRRALQSAGGQFSELSLSHHEEEMPDLNAASIEAAMKIVEGSCFSMGIVVVA